MAISLSAYHNVTVNTSATPVLSGVNPQPRPPQFPNPEDNNPVEAIASSPASRSGGLGTSDTLIVGQPTDQSGAAQRTADFTAANSTSVTGSSQITAQQQQANMDAVKARQGGVLGCLGKSPGTTPGCNNPCDTVDCLTKMLTGNLLDVDAKKLLCDTVNATERALKRQIDTTGDSLLDAAQSLTSLAPVIAPLNALQGMVNKIDPGALANCLGAQALKDQVNGQFNKAKNTVNNFQKGYQDKIAKKFNDATAAAQQFSIAPSMCSNSSPASLRSLIG